MPDRLREGLSLILEELNAVLCGLDAAQCARFVETLAAAPTVFLAGAGRTGLMVQAAAMRLMHLGKTVHIVGGVATPAIRAGDLLLIASGSGSTGGMVAIGEKAVGLGARLAVVTAAPSSPLARLTDAVVIIPAQTPKAGGEPEPARPGAVRSRQPMGNLFEQSLLLFLEASIMELARRGGLDSREMFARHANLE